MMGMMRQIYTNMEATNNLTPAFLADKTAHNNVNPHSISQQYGVFLCFYELNQDAFNVSSNRAECLELGAKRATGAASKKGLLARGEVGSSKAGFFGCRNPAPFLV